MLERRHRPYLISVVVGVLYALVARFILNDSPGDLLSISFLMGTPVALGAVSAHFSAPDASNERRLFLAPTLNTILFLMGALLFHLEGMICILMIAPLFLVLGFVGAGVYGLLVPRRRKSRDKTLIVAAFALLPFVAAPIERQLTTPDTIRQVENSVVINAPAAVVWQHIIRVAPIQPADLGYSLVDNLGFPRPIEATLTHEGVGGVRHATFERGVEFIETVDDWQPQRQLSFSIVPNTATIPPTTFDEHVIVGGKFFVVLRGTYELQPAGPGRTRLVLYSQQRLSTNINWYASIWTSFVMSEIQRRILTVLQHRCETQG